MADSVDRELIEAARQVRECAYAPHSGFKVGAAVRARSGNIYAGCNVENASFGATICAERNAIAAMIAAGERDLETIAVYTDQEALTMPCGICRQVIFEFGPHAKVVVACKTADRELGIGELLPEPFSFR